MMRAARVLALAAAALVSACQTQSFLSPAGPGAQPVSILAWIMFAGAAIIFVAVLASILFAVRGRALRSVLADRRFIVFAGAGFTTLVVTALLVTGLLLLRGSSIANGPVMVVRVTGEQWWWRVEYLGEDGQPLFATANEIRIPVGQPVRFELASADVIHSFWVPALGGKLDMIPGRVNATVLQADRPGIYRGQCAEFCGEQHARMAVAVVALDEAEFAAWLETQTLPAAEPDGEAARRGAEVFAANGCGACHSVRGTDAVGTIGPDLTHVGGRLTIAAGTLPNNVGTLAGWIADPQAIKPGADMPAFAHIGGADLRAVAEYLWGLE